MAMILMSDERQCPHCQAKRVDYRGATIVVPIMNEKPYMITKSGERIELNAGHIFQAIQGNDITF